MSGRSHGGRGPSNVMVMVVAIIVLAGCDGSASNPPGAPSAAGSIAGSTPVSPSIQASSSVPAFGPFDVDVDGVRIHGSCSGTRPAGTPVAVLSHGIGGDYTEMNLMTQHMLEKTMVCGYSRAGVGESAAPAERPRPAADVVAEMYGVLEATRIAPPYFLVGFSGGGTFVMLFAQANPGDVAGFVSINPVPPYTRWIERARDVWSPDELQTVELDWYAGANDEGVDMRATDTLLTDALPDGLPYAVMFAENCGGDTALCKRLEPPLSETTELLARVGAGGRFIPVEGAGHDIDFDQPERVRETLDEVWTEATD